MKRGPFFSFLIKKFQETKRKIESKKKKGPRFGHSKNEEKKKKEKFQALQSCSKNWLLLVFLLIQGCSSTWYNSFSEKATLVASGRLEKKVRMNSFSYIMKLVYDVVCRNEKNS